MMQEYLRKKEEYKDCILFYRLGDFYEMFFDDAKCVSKELELTLTGKDCGLEERAPMCGIPFHAADTYIHRLIEKGYKVAICEQVEDPKQAKGLVKREVIRVVTPGTTLDPSSLDETKNNYLMSIVLIEDHYGIAAADISTGDCFLAEVSKTARLMDEISKFTPSEIICNEAFMLSGIDLEELKERMKLSIFVLDPRYYDDEGCRKVICQHFKVTDPNELGLAGYSIGLIAAGSLFLYLKETQKNGLEQMTQLRAYRAERFMRIDSSSRRNLELVETMREKNKRGSLLWVLDRTCTAMGARLMRAMIEEPLIETDEINRRLEAIADLNADPMLRDELREYLHPVYDLERLLSRISFKTANPRDMVAFASSLAMIPSIRQVLKEAKAPLLRQIYDDMDDLKDVTSLIQAAITDDPPLAQKEGGIIREGYHEQVDTFRRSRTDGKSWLAQLETREKEKTGIKNLKVKFNRVFGYAIEVSNSFKGQVPDYYIRKQTLANAERYITQELKELEDMILGAEDKLYALEYELFSQVRDKVGAEVVRIQKTARALAGLDVFASLALVAEQGGYVRPAVDESGVIDIREGRHPVVEKVAANEMFIPNDTYLDDHKKRISVITGPNMAGKSTYMRQTALIVLMAQMGSFVPAKKARIGIVDRIFTRVGASDDLASGQSTFMVEMTEVANILKNATAKSLLILDEIGRGTSTFDGLAIAWSVIEYISNRQLCGAKTLFATHYHELTELEGKIDGVNNYCIAVKEKGEDIVFLRKIIQGGADKSYGIQVARLAGVPEIVIRRAKELVEELSNADIAAAVRDLTGQKKRLHYDEVDMGQMSLFDTMQDTDILEEIKSLDIGNLTPMEALNFLYNLQNRIVNRWKTP
ncbi:MAG: DNA mismatch repair protein MutS [Blautia sp.]|nr:DNA mismatch repair protein MutS [Blautia sp.]